MSSSDTTPSGVAGTAAYLREKRAELLRFAAGARCAEGFAWLDDAGVPEAGRPVELWITARATYVFALGVLADEPPAPGGPDLAALRSLAEHGIQALAHGSLRDPEFGGWYGSVGPDQPVSDLKQAYGHAFVIFAAAAAVVAGIDGAPELLDDSLALTIEKFWDEERGLAAEEWDRTWSRLDGYRGLNGNLHLVEAMLAAGDATGERRWHEIAGRIAAHVVDFTRANGWRVPNHFDAQWQPDLDHNRHLPDHPFRPFGAMVGDAFEWTRLLVGVAGTLGDDAPDGLLEAATNLYDQAVADGWAADGADGFVYTTDWEGRPVVRARMHWVLLEAINAGESLRQVTGQERFAKDEARWWQYAEAHLVDHELGSWYHELDVNNRPAATVWSGKPDPYHAYQTVLLPTLPVVPSLARALAEADPSR